MGWERQACDEALVSQTEVLATVKADADCTRLPSACFFHYKIPQEPANLCQAF